MAFIANLQNGLEKLLSVMLNNLTPEIGKRSEKNRKKQYDTINVRRAGRALWGSDAKEKPRFGASGGV
jgi:hypothetical protein